MTVYSTIAAIVLGYLAGFINHKAGTWTYYRQSRNVLHMPLAWNSSPMYRAFIYAVVVVLSLVSLFFSRHWLLSAAIIIWIISSWKSGHQVAYRDSIASMARHVMEREHISLAEALPKAKEIIDTFRSIR